MTGKQFLPRRGRCSKCHRRNVIVHRFNRKWYCYECFISDDCPTIDQFVYGDSHFASAELHAPGFIGRLIPKGETK